MRPFRLTFAAPATLAALFTLACTDTSSSSNAPSNAPAPAPPAASASAAGREGIHWTQALAGQPDASPLIRDALLKEQASGRTLLVYVGATWCEPCQRFHHAVEGGQLDAAFPRLSFLAFDADRDGPALAAAGYASRLIPLFAIPRSDGHSSGRQIEGSVKGETAVSEITPRLRALVSGGS